MLWIIFIKKLTLPKRLLQSYHAENWGELSMIVISQQIIAVLIVKHTWGEGSTSLELERVACAVLQRKTVYLLYDASEASTLSQIGQPRLAWALPTPYCSSTDVLHHLALSHMWMRQCCAVVKGQKRPDCTRPWLFSPRMTYAYSKGAPAIAVC